MKREEIIKIIENLYPADSAIDPNKTGQQLLLKAIFDCWRFLPEEILMRYMNLCIVEEKIHK